MNIGLFGFFLLYKLSLIYKKRFQLKIIKSHIPLDKGRFCVNIFISKLKLMEIKCDTLYLLDLQNKMPL